MLVAIGCSVCNAAMRDGERRVADARMIDYIESPGGADLRRTLSARSASDDRYPTMQPAESVCRSSSWRSDTWCDACCAIRTHHPPHHVVQPHNAPLLATLDPLALAGHSGQPVADIARYAQACVIMDGVSTGPLEMTVAAPSARLTSGVVSGDGDIVVDEIEEGVAAPVPPHHHHVAFDTITGTGAGADARAAAAAAVSPARAAGVGDAGRAAAASAAASAAARVPALGALINTLMWRHLAPTAPDTLACFPATTVDPFVLADDEQLPALLFSGNAPAFATALVGGVRVVAVPAFATTRTAVLVDLASPTLEVQPVTFTFGGAGVTGLAGGSTSLTEDDVALAAASGRRM